MNCPQMLDNHPTFKRGSSLCLVKVAYQVQKSRRDIVGRYQTIWGNIVISL